MQPFEFEVGKQYRNRRGLYTVLELKPPKMTVRYEDGTTGELTIEQQSNIVRNMLLEEQVRTIQEAQEKAQPRPASRATPKPAAEKPARQIAPRPDSKRNSNVNHSAAVSETNNIRPPRRILLQNDPSDQTFKAGEIRIFTEFRGFGNQYASIWFIGFEEHSEYGTVELKHRLKMEVYEEPYADLSDRLKAEQYPLEYRYATPEWRIMAFTGLRFAGKRIYPNVAELEEYYSKDFGTLEGNILISELMPLPVPNGNEWPYSNIKISDNSMLQYQLRDRKIYTQTFLPERIAMFQNFYEQRKNQRQAPRYIFCYGGRKNWVHYRKIFPLTYVEISLPMRSGGQDAGLMLGRDNDSGTWVILTGQLNDSRGEVTTYLCDQLAQRLEQL
jgi:hypothetical protein